ncbi:T9SS type A sorting domain-containing protein [Seonamhaeicola sp.]|uniref:T9SS type A sorting domain-containing protein n=1 Tax=Seonamhaeicola sp. TaxID=1912245 RepID=UPI002603264D|nr:T9SS type A sorting domain-containing protein [Seonamhaeicola sp.]
MKNLNILFLFLLISGVSFGQTTSDRFAYTDGNLVGNGGWTSHSGSGGFIQVSSGQAVIVHGSGSKEDANISFSAVSGSIYYSFDFSVDDLGNPYSGTDNEYFAHFMVGTGSFSARLDIVPPSAGGDFNVGISTLESSADNTWPTDLSFATTYRVTVKYDQNLNQAQLWIDATLETDTSILGSDETDPGNAITAFALRQSTSSENETIRIDNLVIASSFSQALSTKENQIEGFSMHPNPTDPGYVTISSKSNSKMQVSVFDMLGKQILSSTVRDNTLNVSDLNTGIYLLKVSQDETISTKKLVIK